MSRPTINPDEITRALNVDDALLSGEELAALLGVSIHTVRAWRWRGVGPDYLRLGPNIVKYKVATIKAYMAGFKVVAAADGATPGVKRARAAKAEAAAAEADLFA